MMRRPTTRQRVAAISLSVLALAACSSTAQPGAAAIVGGVGIADSTVADNAQEITALLGASSTADSAQLNRQIIAALVQEQVINTAATNAGVTVTQTQVDQLITQAAEQSGGREKLEQGLATQYGVAPSTINAFALANLQFQGLAAKLGQGDPQTGSTAASALIAQTSQQIGVEVSPRFGEWAPAQLAVLPPANDLSAPPAGAPQPTQP